MMPRPREPATVLVAAEQRWHPDSPVDSGELVDQRCYKTLSLRLAASSGIAVPRSVLLLKNSADALEWVWRNWDTPLIMRVDYSALPRNKVLGGIAISSSETLRRLSDWLFRQSYYPLVHSFLDRFRNIHSAGALIARDSVEASIEVVGTGFDASDLRLGTCPPHEAFEVDLCTGHTFAHRQPSAQQYAASREGRIQSIARLQAYTRFVNAEGYLLSDLHDVEVSDEDKVSATALVPTKYAVLPESYRRALVQSCKRLRDDVIPILPRSATYAASFSYFEEFGWILWDVYGEWYVR